MKDLVILGAGGLGRELLWLVEEINEDRQSWNVLGFLDSSPAMAGAEVLGKPVLGPIESAAGLEHVSFVVAFGDPVARWRAVQAAGGRRRDWATLVSPTVRLHASNTLGVGVVIGRHADLTVENRLGDHVMLNVHVVVGHGTSIGDYSIVSPNATINGGATIGRRTSVGANAFVRDVVVGEEVTIGASSCVVRDVPDRVVVVGVPAKIVRDGRPRHSVTTSERESGLPTSEVSWEAAGPEDHGS